MENAPQQHHQRNVRMDSYCFFGDEFDVSVWHGTCRKRVAECGQNN